MRSWIRRLWYAYNWGLIFGVMGALALWTLFFLWVFGSLPFVD